MPQRHSLIVHWTMGGRVDMTYQTEAGARVVGFKRMNFTALSNHGYLLVAGLVLIGLGLMIISLIVNVRVVHSVRTDERHREKLFEYYRNTFSQLGVILIGIGLSLFIYFFQQSYKDENERNA